MEPMIKRSYLMSKPDECWSIPGAQPQRADPQTPLTIQCKVQKGCRLSSRIRAGSTDMRQAACHASMRGLGLQIGAQVSWYAVVPHLASTSPGASCQLPAACAVACPCAACLPIHGTML